MARNAIVSDGVGTGEQVKYDADEGLFVRDAGQHVYEPGLYYVPPHSTRTTSVLPEGNMRGLSFLVGEKTSFDRIGASVTSSGEAGSVVRLGIYGPDTLPGEAALVVDAGTVAGDSIGEKELTVDVTLEPGVYWLVAVAQSCPTTAPTVRVASSGPTVAQPGISSLSTALGAGTLVSPVATGVSGALPASGLDYGAVSVGHLVALRAA